MPISDVRVYDRTLCVVFMKTREAFGGLSNMAAGFPLSINGVRILTTEALYQACRFPSRPLVQQEIIAQLSPMTAKMKSKPYRKSARSDFDAIRLQIMRWCLQVKLAQNWESFGELLLATGDKPIVEESRRDAFWGAKAQDDSKLEGVNALGRLLMELREQLKGPNPERLLTVEPPSVPDFLLLGQPIGAIQGSPLEPRPVAPPSDERPLRPRQLSLEFDATAESDDSHEAGISSD